MDNQGREMIWSTSTDNVTDTLQRYVNETKNGTRPDAANGNHATDNSSSALLYIVCVLCFYAFSIVILMVKYVRREREEADQRNFFNEFIKRDKFNSAQYQNQLMLQKLLKTVKVDTTSDNIRKCNHGNVECSHGNSEYIHSENESPQPGQAEEYFSSNSATSSLYELAEDEAQTKV